MINFVKLRGLILIWALSLLHPLSGQSLAEVDLTFSDSNLINSFKNSSGEYRAYDFNRFRSSIDAGSPSGRIHLKAMLDIETYISRAFLDSSDYQAIKDAEPDLPFNPHWNAFESNDVTGRLYLYRIFMESKLDKSRLVFGLQRIPFGVGRLWNPTDTFNPVDVLIVEPQERPGVFAVNYTQYLSDFASLRMISSFGRKMALDKYGLRYKGHQLGIDMGFSYIQNSDFLMAGLELESNLFDTGMEIRGEMGFFNNDDLDKRYFSGVTGLEYAFPNNVTILGEYFYNGLGADDKNNYDTGIFINGNWNLSRHYLGCKVSYELNPLTTLSLSAIYNLPDGSFFNGPSVGYSVNDETTLTAGANVFTGNNSTEFGGYYNNLYYIKLETYF